MSFFGATIFIILSLDFSYYGQKISSPSLEARILKDLGLVLSSIYLLKAA